MDKLIILVSNYQTRVKTTKLHQAHMIWKFYNVKKYNCFLFAPVNIQTSIFNQCVKNFH